MRRRANNQERRHAYPPPTNFKPGTIWTSDNLPIMRGMNSACIDLIYLDPPFNSNADYAAPIGSEAAGAEFKDTWSLDDVKTEWVNLIKMKHSRLHRVLLAAPNDSMKSYLIYMAIRILEMKRILKPTGTIYLHCDPTASHYLKVLMDSVFGQSNFRNEIVWCYSNSGRSKRKFTAKHDIILCYGNGGETTWTGYRVEARQEYIDQMYRQRDHEGRQCRIRVDAGKQRIYYPEDGVTCNDWWADIPSLGSIARERVGYPTQKPLALLKRIIDASSNPGDMVLDPFCGCATALVAADRRQRNWVGIDVGEKAAELVETRIRKDQGEEEYQNNLPEVFNEPIRRSDRPMRDDLGRLPKPTSHKSALYGESGGYCPGCEEHFEKRHMEVDHIISKNEGGNDHKDNLQLLCSNCNRVKGDRGMEYLMSVRKELKMGTRKGKRSCPPNIG